jgi:hypothetical protein
MAWQYIGGMDHGNHQFFPVAANRQSHHGPGDVRCRHGRFIPQFSASADTPDDGAAGDSVAFDSFREVAKTEWDSSAIST